MLDSVQKEPFIPDRHERWAVWAATIITAVEANPS